MLHILLDVMSNIPREDNGKDNAREQHLERYCGPGRSELEVDNCIATISNLLW